MTPPDDDEKSAGLNIDIGVGAKASYEISKKIIQEVPEDVTRTKAKAFLDAISPFTQASGLLGDWIEDKRERLRLHRLQTLTEIANKARKQIEEQAKQPNPVPVKALIPMLERASLEESDDETLTTAWAALIASASLEYDAEVTTFSRILSELSPRECLILQRVFDGRWDWVSGTRPPGGMIRFFESEAEIKPMLRQAVVKEDKSVFSKLRNYVDPSFPIEFTRAVTRGTSQRANWIDKVLKEPFFAENELGYLMLETQGLIMGRGQGYSWNVGETPVGVDWVELTDLGSRFVDRVIPRTYKQKTKAPES